MFESEIQCYSIVVQEDKVKFINIREENFYDEFFTGFRRKAYVSDPQLGPDDDELFIDDKFKLPTSNDYSLVRLYDLYQKQVDIFPENNYRSSLISYKKKYNSFLAQSGLIDVKYLRTLFLTQRVNQKGYYRYFVKRDGQYYISCIDDEIPVDKKTHQPLWGLSLKYPWQLLLLKAWLKEKKTWENFQSAPPFQLLDAFGFTAYKNFNFKKEIQFIKEEKIDSQQKQAKLKNSALNSKTVRIYAKTLDSQKIYKVGLPSNLAAFKISLIDIDEENIYHVESSVPIGWAGKNTLIAKNNIKKYLSTCKLSLEKSLIMTETQVLNYFNKFYVVPEIALDINEYKIQDTFQVNTSREENWISFSATGKAGLLTLSIQLPRKSYDYRQRYPEITFFLSKKNSEEQIAHSNIRQDLRESRKEGNHYIESDCDKWQNYGIDYQQGYYFNSVSYVRLTEGQYILYCKVSPKCPYRIRFHSEVSLSPPQFATLTASQIKTIYDSTFFGIAQSVGIQTSLKKQQNFDESIVLANSFDEIGFGVVCIKTFSHAKHKIAMRIFPKKLRENGLDLCQHYYQAFQEEKGKNIVLVSHVGRPQMIVLKRIDKTQKDCLNKPFPPIGAIQFFKLMPKSKENMNRSLNKTARKNDRSKSNKSKKSQNEQSKISKQSKA